MAEREQPRARERRGSPNRPRNPERVARTPAEPMADRQAAIGNRAIQQRLGARPPGVQTKLEISGPADEHEREADRVADAVLSMPDPAVQRQPDTDDLEDMEQEALAPRLDRRATPASTVAPQAESAINRRRGGGRPLDRPTRGYFEPRLGRDLSGVRVHTDPGAARLASDVGAQAFTVGRDMYFAEGRFQPGTESGRSLIAHELAHTVQQRPGAKLADGGAADLPAHRASQVDHAVQRTADVGAIPPKSPDAGVITEGSSPTITYPVLKVMNFKATGHRAAAWNAHRNDLRRSRDYGKRPTNYEQVWRDSLNSPPTMESLVRNKLASTLEPTDSGKVYVLRHQTSDYRLIGTLRDLVTSVQLPVWDRKGGADPKDIDHIVELVVSGWPHSAWANKAGRPESGQANLELLDNRANRQSGVVIGNREIPRLLRATRDYFWRREGEPLEGSDRAIWVGDKAPTNKEILERYDLRFAGVEGGYANEGRPDNHWQWEEVSEGKHLEGFTPDTSPGSNSTWAIFPFASGGVPRLVDHTGDEVAEAGAALSRGWLDPFTVSRYYLDDPGSRPADQTDHIGWIEVQPIPQRGNDAYAFFEGGATTEVFVKPMPGLTNAGYLDSSGLLQVWDYVTARGLSPIEISSFTLVEGEGIRARGSLLPNVPIMTDLAIELVVEGKAVYLARRFDIGDFDLPGPIAITHSSVEVTAGTNGLGASGELGLAIEGVGDGLVTARIGTRSGFALGGAFTFDPELFDPPSQIEIGYEDGEFSGSGLLTIGKDRVRGIRTASIEATYADGRLEATGEAELEVPGLERGSMSLSYSETEGFAIGGAFELSSDVPGISSGSVEAEVRRSPEGGYSVSASGTAVPAIPGVSARVDVAYVDGIFTAEATAGYERGMLSGSLEVGATNEAIDDDGEPTGEPTDRVRAFGGGELNLQLAPWLEASAGVRITPEAEVEVTGRIGLPAALEVFPARRYDRNIFTLDLDIPIVGVTVPIIRQNIGIFATIGGGLDLTAGFGPGELRDLGLEITYNPDREQDTEVTGGAEFVVPADAGLRLFVRGSLGAGIPVVTARLGLEVGGGLGIEGAVRAGVEVAWTPNEGIKLDAEAEIFAEPKLKVDITGFALVEASVRIRTFELYSQRWNLAALEYGSGLRLGATFPIHYVEGEPFDVSMDDIEFQVPDIDPRALLTGLVDQVT